MKLRLAAFLAISTILIFSSCGKKCNIPYPEGKHLINTDEAGNNIAMEGYDLLTFFEDKPIKGNDTIVSIHRGIKYLFVSDENRKSFMKNPEAILPKYGGFCAVAASFGNAEELQTYNLYDVIDGRLYFQKNQKANNMWKKGPEKIIAKADGQWNCIVNDLGIDINKPYREPKEIK